MQRPLAYIITVGDELLRGDIVDTNSAFLATRCRALGLELVRTVSVRDRIAEIAGAVCEAATHGATVCLLSGGLGPTTDDVTAVAVAQASGRAVALDPAAAQIVAAAFERFAAAADGAGLVGQRARTLATSPENQKQALLPTGSVALANSRGTAPGIWVSGAIGGMDVVCMPGVPGELRAMMIDEVEPRLRERFDLTVSARRIYRTLGRGESQLAPAVERRVEAIREEARAGQRPAALADLVIRYRAAISEVRVTLEAERVTDAELATLDAAMIESLGAPLYGIGEDGLAPRVVDTLAARGLTIAVADSLGGRLITLLTACPGASACLVGGLVPYADAVKVAQVGVSAATLAEHGAVSAEVAATMARAVRASFHADLAVAITGIAGPSGAREGKPVGTVDVAVVDAAGEVTRRLALVGVREEIQHVGALRALKLLWDRLRDRGLAVVAAR
ncbi:MAG: CinA family nicotinamide mononucleotide deamidase-related protein [Nannocystaceae bacterium]